MFLHLCLIALLAWRLLTYLLAVQVLQLVPMGLRHIDNFLRPLEFGDYMLKAQLNSGSFETVCPICDKSVFSQISHHLCGIGIGYACSSTRPSIDLHVPIDERCA